MPVTEKKDSAVADLPVHVYSPDRGSGILEILKSLIREFPVAHALGFRFAERNIKSRYRQSMLGILWAFMPPLATALVWIMLYETNIINLSDVGAPYPLFVLTGTMLWSVFSGAVLTPMQTMQANRSILVKINFPREALMVNAFYEILFNAGIAMIIIIAELIIFRVGLDAQSLLFIPAIFLLIVLGMAIGLLLLPLSLLYKDVQFVLPSLLQFLMYLTPVVYAKPVYEGATKILDFNPVTPVLTGARAWLLGLDTMVPSWQILVIAGASLLLLFIGIIFQRITVAILIERMGS